MGSTVQLANERSSSWMAKPVQRSANYASHIVDQSKASIEPGHDSAAYVPIVLHPSLVPQHRLTKAERVTMLIKVAALRIAAGMEPRTLREVAIEIGCSHTAIDNALQRICDRIGIRKHVVSDDTRSRQSEARRRNIDIAA
jgi:hypothetical protein